MADKFFTYHAEVFKEGGLTARENSLIALGVAHALQCPYCNDTYTSDTLEKGCDKEQMMEAVNVAAAIRDGASLVHRTQMKNKTKKFDVMKWPLQISLNT